MSLLTKTGRLVGQITSPFTKNIELRVEQFKRHRDETFRLNLSKAVVKGKLANCLSFVKTFSSNHPEINLKGEMSGLEASINSKP